jgi:chromosome segregation ATPase
MLDDLSGVHEREIALSGGLSQLRTRATRFDEALIGLARVQGRMVARLEAQTVRADEVEKLAGRRDDHITRLIRDTAAQRGEIERLARRVGEVDQRDADFRRRLELVEVGADENDRLVRVESQVSDLKRLQKTGIQSARESLDGLRDRVGRLEARAAEMSREARAKSGRLDALARHVASVEGRLTTAIGKGGGNVVTVAARKIEDFEGADESRRALGAS